MNASTPTFHEFLLHIILFGSLCMDHLLGKHVNLTWNQYKLMFFQMYISLKANQIR